MSHLQQVGTGTSIRKQNPALLRMSVLIAFMLFHDCRLWSTRMTCCRQLEMGRGWRARAAEVLEIVLVLVYGVENDAPPLILYVIVCMVSLCLL